ncbi:preprotein translocase subunit SecG [Methylovirgula ligni]|uniref:Protein-export membrane protein SecG n=1 Tax=Methylovirgula ligni TaxID=569860 RepID=A0A3D9Z0N2_9HYPH|nr:preprotein translocase subunit SecG [Methylovirgula ligni]QAY96784.1 preprotein translocase subunit SecG [Methylovirgula ligni]REF88185.1 preprotein translocase subunit SecG [Methylovirgula ligni]
MQTVLIVIHIMIVLALIATVLLQRSEGGALGIGGGGFMTGRGQANVLTRATAILGALFFVTSLTLTLLANANRPSKSIFEGAVAPAAAPGAPAGQGTLLQQLKKQQQDLQEHPQPPGPPAQPEPPRSQ